MKTSVLELGNLIQGFKLSCQTEGKSPKTIEWYTSFLLRFLRFLEQSELPTQLDRIERTHIRRFILCLQQEARTPHTNKPLSGATVQGYVRALKAFSAWAEREEYTPTNLMAKIPIPKAETKVITTFSEVQIQSLFTLCLSSNGNSIRNTQGDGFIDSPYLFPDKYGGPVTVNSIQQYLRRLAQKAGLGDVKVTPHIFRHTAATHAAAQGTNAFILKEIMGHTSIQTTMRYVHPQPDDLKAQHNRFSMVNDIFQKK